MDTRKLIVDTSVKYDPKVTFIGEHLTKRELEVVIRAIKREHRRRINEFRKKRIIAIYEADKAKQDKQVKQAEEAEQKSEVKDG